MTQQPYSPWPVAEKPVSQDRMREILAARTNNVAAPSPKPAEECPVASGPPSSAAPGAEGPLTPAKGRKGPLRAAKLEWRTPHRHGDGVYSVRDMAERYRIDILVKRGGEASYTCWRLSRGPGELHYRLGCVDERNTAKALCETDAQSG